MIEYTDNPTFNLTAAAAENVLGTYNGEDPTANTLMTGVLDKMFLTKDSKGQDTLKVIYKTAGGKWDGYAAWDQITLTDAAAFKWKALCEEVLMVPITALTENQLRLIDHTQETGAGYQVESIGEAVLDGYTPIMFSVSYRDYTADDGTVSKQTKVTRVWNQAFKG
jgi:hypothetical protein